MSFFNELKRRNVFKVGVAYLITAWLLIQVADILLDNIGAPAWVLQAIFVALGVGLFISLVVAWAFELTPEGIKKEKDVDRTRSIAPHTGKKLNLVIIALLVIGMGYFIWESRFSRPDSGLESAPPAVAVVQQPLVEENPVSTEPEISRQSIAVLPFDNRSTSVDDEYFTEGIHDDLLTNLARIGSLKVISRTSVNRYKGSDKSIPEIAAELGVATVMEGAVQRAGDSVRINVQLIDARTDEHLWAEIYDRELTAANIFSIQSEISLAIANALRAELSDDETQRLAMQPTQNLAAYEAYLLGRQRFAKRTGAEMAEAAVYFQQAIDLDPDFVLAYVGLADVYQVQADWGLVTTQEANSKSLPLADKALQLDPRSGEAYVTLASIHEYSGDFEEAGQAYQRALELTPNYPQASFWYGLYLMQSMGQPAEAILQFEHALSQDPLSPIVLANLASADLALGDFETAHALQRRVLEIDPTFAKVLGDLGMFAWAVKGDLVTAIDYNLQAHRADRDDQWSLSSAAELFAVASDEQSASCLLSQGADLFGDSNIFNVQRSLQALYSAEPDAAESFARQALEHTWVPFAKQLPLAIIQARLQHGDQLADALALYQKHFPELIETPLKALNLNNFKVAVNLAALLQAMGRQPDALQLLDGSEQYIQHAPRLGDWGYGIDDVRIQMLRGENEKALAALRTAVGSGWRYYWRYYLEFDPILEPLHDDLRYQAIVQAIRADMAAQLSEVRSRGLDQGLCKE